MCGLILLLKPGLQRDATIPVTAAMKAMAHRGLPGRNGTWYGEVAMGFVRLPIRGIGSEYDQPFETKEWAGMFVGEIFDVPEKNDALWALEELYFKKFPEFLTLCDGFWGMVLHDKESGQTDVITDHLSIKPLYYHEREGIISSELRGIEAITKDLTVNQHYISNVLKWGYDPSHRTAYNEVQRLEAGCWFSFEKGKLVWKRKYFPLISESYGIKDAVVTATRMRLVSDIPVASLCSGGLDSTIVSLLAARFAEKLTVFHVDNDEAEYVEAIDWPANVNLVKISLPLTSLADALRATEEPVDLGSVHPQYALGRAVRDAGFNVVLSGDGADELFGGYRRAQEYDSQYSDIFSELVHYHLPRLDKTMMASTVEIRSPFLAPKVIQGALAVPYSKRTKKQILKEAFSDIVPRVILEREKKALKALAVVEGGIVYRQRVVEAFLAGSMK